jgi:DNA-binding NarL/FixJ family response regulator
MTSQHGSEEFGDGASPLSLGRKAYAARAWSDAYALLTRAGELTALADEDLEKLAWSAALSGHDNESLRLLERLYQLRVDAEPPRRAASAAFWIGFRMLAVEPGRSGAWLARARRLAEREPNGCAEQGYLLVPDAIRMLGTGDLDAAKACADTIIAIGEQFAEPNVIAFGRVFRGRALVRMGQIEDGLAISDEVMLAATSGELAPTVTGLVYCMVIATFQQVYAMRRAREWTDALAAWCEAQPQLVPFAGTCLVHRAEIMQLCGAWDEASEEVRRCAERPAFPRDGSIGEALYQQAELKRLRGDFAQAEEGYRRASEKGREPQPGLALLRFAQGRTDAAHSAIQRVLDSTRDELRRAQLLPAYVEIALGADRPNLAETACAELEATAQRFATEILSALAGQARGALLLTRGDPCAALERLRAAFVIWHELDAPYLAARVRVLIGRACEALGDGDGAELELAAARCVFQNLGATRDLAALDEGSVPVTTCSAESDPITLASGHRLSARETEVLRLLAAGKTNKEIAKALFVSDRTVDRHVSNIFDKLDVRTRAAATAYALRHGLA